MTELSSQERWILQPLTDAGLAADQVCDLVGRLAFETIVRSGRPTPVQLSSLVADQPADVRSAWVEVLDRMTSGPCSAREQHGDGGQPEDDDRRPQHR